MDSREERGLELAKVVKIHRKGNVWTEPYQNGKGRYWVRPNGDKPLCWGES